MPGVNVEIGVKGASEFAKNINDSADALAYLKDVADGAASEVDAFEKALQQIADDKAAQEKIADLAESTAQIASGIATQAAAAIRMTEAFFGAASGTAEYADEIDKASQKLGISTTAYQEWDYVLRQSGSSMSQMRTAFARLRSVQTGYVKEAADDLETLGLSLDEISAMSREDAFAAIVEGLQGIADINVRDAIVRDLFGSGAEKTLGPLLNSSAEEIAALIEHLHELGGVMSEDQVKAGAEFSDSVDDLQTKMQGLKNTILSEFLPALSELTQKITENDSLDKLAEHAANLAENGVVFLEYIVDHADQTVTAVEAIGAAWATWKGAEIVTTLVTNVRQLYQWLGLLGGVLGIGAAGAAGLVAGGAMGAVALVDRISEQSSSGYLGAGHSAEEYAANVAYLEGEVERLTAAYNEAALYSDNLFMEQDALDQAIIALGHAREEYAAMSEAQTDTGTETADAATTFEEATTAVQEASRQTLAVIEETAGEISEDWTEGVDEMSTAAAEAVKNTNDVMSENMGVLSSNASVWGTDFMISFANGIVLGFNDFVLPALTDVAQTMTDMMGHSHPKTGPLAKDYTWAPDMMELFASGIKNNEWMVSDAIRSAFDLAPILDAQRGTAGPRYNYGGVSVVINAAPGQSAEELYDEFSYRLQHDVLARGAVFA